MNKCYKKVWSQALGQVVVASELAGGNGTGAMRDRRHTVRMRIVAAAMLLGLSVLSVDALAADAVCVDPVTGLPVGTTSGTANEVACGQGATASGADAVAIGNGAAAAGSSAVALGEGATASSSNTVSIGFNAGLGQGGAGANINIGVLSGQNASGFQNTFIGQAAGSGAVGNLNTSIGTLAGLNAIGDSNNNFGGQAGALANGNWNTNTGFNAGVQVIGNTNISNGVAAGAGITGNGNVSIGANANAPGLKVDTATGLMTVTGAAGLAVNDTTALGNATLANFDGDVALGSGSVTAAAVATPSATINGTTYNFAGINPVSTVSVGTVGMERTLTNVAAGRISATSTDAINGSQLYATNMAIENVATIAKAGWNTTTAATGTGTVAGTSVANVAPGATVTTTAGNNIAITQNGTDLTIATTPDLVADSLTINGGPVISTAGINMGNTTITNLAAGVNGTDAVNLNQLTQVSNVANAGWNVSAQGANASNVAPGETVDLNNADGNIVVSKNAADDNVTFNLSDNLTLQNVTVEGNSVFNGSSTFNGPAVMNGGATIGGNLTVLPGTTVNMGGNAITNVAAGVNGTDAVNLNQVNQIVAGVGGGFTLSAQGAAQTAVDKGENIDLNNTDGNIVVSKTTANNDVSFDLADDLNINSVTMGGTVLNAGGLTIAGGPSITVGGINAGGTTITNVAAGVNGTDAVNVNQLNSAISNLTGNWNLSTNGGTATPVKSGDTVDIKGDGNVNVSNSGTNVTVGLNRNLDVDSITAGNTTVNSNGVTIAGGPSMTVNGIDAGGKQIHNVQAGTANTDAVNVGQLNSGLASAINTANSYTDQKLSNLQGDVWNLYGRVNDLEKNMQAGVATALSLKQAPFVPGKTTYYAGVGAYKSQGAIGISLRRTADNGRWSLEGGFSGNRDGVGGYIGVSGVLGGD